MIDTDWDADSLEYYITKNSHVTPSEHLLSLHPSVFWILDASQMEQISNSVESIIIKRDVGEKSKSFKLSSLRSLLTLEIGRYSFQYCHSIVFESMNDWMNDEWDLNRLQSIILRNEALQGDARESNELMMRSTNEYDDWLIRSPFSILTQRRWIQFLLYGKSDIGECDWWLNLN